MAGLNPIELYFLLLSAVCLIGAGSFFEMGMKNKKEAAYWKRKYYRAKREDTDRDRTSVA